MPQAILFDLLLYANHVANNGLANIYKCLFDNDWSI